MKQFGPGPFPHADPFGDRCPLRRVQNLDGVSKRAPAFAVSYSAWPVLAAGLLTAFASVAAIWFFYRDGSLMNFGDSESHLNIARRVLDSRTPGYDQLGSVWLPLPHLLMIPFRAEYAPVADRLCGIDPFRHLFRDRDHVSVRGGAAGVLQSEFALRWRQDCSLSTRTRCSCNPAL